MKKKAHIKSNKNKTMRYTVEEESELLTFLLQKLSNKGRNTVKAMLTRGQVLIDNKKTTKYNAALKIGQTVTIETITSTQTNRIEGITILHEDDDLIVIEKDAGILSMSTGKEGELTAYRQLTDYVRAKHRMNRIFIVHRLDRDTSGVMIFAKNQKAKDILQETWKQSVEERIYVALVKGKLNKPEGTITSWLKESKTLLMYSSPTPNGGKKAITHYKVIKSNDEYSLLEIHLDTGRKNQIRVHMKDIGHPIVGDKKYGSTSRVIGRLGLHAQAISFTHPITGQMMRFESVIPAIFDKPLR